MSFRFRPIRHVGPIAPGMGSFPRGLSRIFRASASAALLLLATPALSQTAPDLGEAFDFTVLGTNATPTSGTVTCTNTGIGSTINGDVGTTFTSITNTGCTINGTITAPVSGEVVTDFNNAYNELDALNPACDGAIPTTSAVLPPGVYCSDAGTTIGAGVTFTLNGTASDVWVFKVGTGGSGDLAGTGFSVVMGDSAEECNVYWRTAQAVTMTDSNFKGSVLAGSAITMTRGSWIGRALATTDVTVTDAAPMTFDGCSPPSTITVNKDFIPDSTATVPVDLSCTSGTVDATPLDAAEGAPAVFTVGAADPGATCTATETVPAGHTADQGDCENVPLGGSCTIVNTQQGQITISKNAIGGDGSFDFTGDLGLFNLTTTGGTAQTTFSDLAPDTYNVAETVPAGWTLTSASCDNGDTPDAITLGAGESVNCTFVNSLQGTIIVEKQTLPDGSAQSFAFTGTAAGSITDGETIVVNNLDPGTYTSTEALPAGWDLTSIMCDDNDSTGNTGTATATFNLQAGETVRCVFTNTERGTIVVEKQTLPDGAPDVFTFTGNAAGNISDGQQITVGNLVPGNYSATETVPANWKLTGISCNDGNSSGDVGSATANFVLDPGETVACVFTNTQGGSITVEKQTLPNGSLQAFDFTGDVAGSITDGNSITILVDPGTYTSTETVPADWDLTSIVCDDLNSTGNIGTATATFNVDPDEAVRCVFTNTERGTIVVEKQTNPPGSLQSFGFTGDGAGNLTDDGQIIVGNLAPGNYSSTEAVPEGWKLTDIACDDADSTGDIGTATANFALDAGETVTCVFTNTQRGSITVEKQTLPEGSLQAFDFTGDVAGSLTDGNSITILVDPGTYTSTETLPAGWDLTSIVCDDLNSTGDIGAATATFNVEADEAVRCVFTNTERGTIVVEKQTLPDGAPDVFTFTGNAAGNISDGQQITVGNLVPGNYSSTESVPANWKLTGISCNDGNSSGDVGSATANFVLDPGETVACVFTNTQGGSITVEKQTLPNGSLQAFGFTGDVAGSLTDGNSITILVDPGTYTSTETLPAGWDLTSIVCDDLNSTGDIGAATATFNVEADEAVRCVFTNTQHGTLIVEKQTNPQGSLQSFSFTGDAAGNLTDGEQIIVGNLAPGNYSATETLPAGWELTNITCNDADSTGDIETATANFVLDADESVTCVFVNTEILPEEGTITILKQANPSGTGQSFSFSGNLGIFNLMHGQFIVRTRPPGIYSVSETVPPGWRLDSALCNDGSPVTGIDLQAGENVTCTFSNIQLPGTIIVEKQTNPAGSLQSFTFTGDAAGNLTDNEQIVVDNLSPGNYSATESLPAGWQLTDIVCNDADSSGDLTTAAANFVLDAGETVTCVFINTEEAATEGTITILKQANPSDTGTSFDFSGDLGSFSLMHGHFIVETRPPGIYGVSETVPLGWRLDSATCNDGSPVTGIDLQAGENVTCTFTNSILAVPAISVPAFTPGGFVLLLLVMSLIAAVSLKHSGPNR